jgi:hypothetical protein
MFNQFFKHDLVVAVFREYNFTCLEKTSKHTKMYLTPPLPVGKGPYKSTEHSSPGLLGTWLLSFMSNNLFGCLTLWQISHDAINLRTLRPMFFRWKD